MLFFKTVLKECLSACFACVEMTPEAADSTGSWLQEGWV